MAPSAAAWHTADCLAAGCGELVKVWQPGNPNSEIKIFEGTSVYCLDFSRNNKVLAVAGDKGQVALYSSRPQTPSGERIVGRAPEVPKAALDSFTCVRWAPSGTHLVGGTRNGMLCIFALKAKQEERILGGLTGSATSVAINHTTELLASASLSGQVLLHDFRSGQKYKPLVRGGGHAAGSLCFSRLAPAQLAAGNGCGQLLVWDVDRMELSDELAVHKGAVAGLSFSEASPELLLSCGVDGTTKCTDRRTQKAVWSVAAQRGCSFSSLSAKHDGQLFAVGTGSGSVQVHDVRRASQVLSLQQFSDTSSPVTTVRWQHLHVSKGSSRAASASVAPSSTVTPSASVAPTASAAVSSAATTTWQRQQQQAAAMVGQRAAAAAGNTAAGAGAGKSPGLLSEVSNTSVSVDFGMRALSPVQMLGSPTDEAESAPPLPLQPSAAAAPSTSTLRTPAAAPSAAAAAAAANTLVTPPAAATPADSSVSAGPGAAPFMFTPGIGLGHLAGANTTPVLGAADVTPMSRATGAGAANNSAFTAAAPLHAAPAAAMPEPAAPAAEATGRLGIRRNSSSTGLDSRQPAAAPGKPAGRATLLSGVAAGAGSSAAAGASAAGGGAASGRGSGPSRSNSGVSATAAAAAAAAGGGGKAGSRPASGASGSGVSAAVGSAAAGSSRRTTRSSADGSGEAPAAAAAATAGSRPGAAASAGGEGAAAAEASGKGSDAQLLPPSRPGSAAAAVVGGLREDVFKAYVDQQMAELKQDVKAMHLDMLRQFHQAQMDLVSVVDGVVQRQDQLAEMMAELAAAVQGLRSNKQQPGGLMPWI